MNRILLGIILLAMTAPALAVFTTARPAGYPVAPPAVKPEAAKAMADDSSGLRRGTVEKVNHANGTFHVFGHGLNFDPRRVRIYARNGQAVAPSSLKAGTPVKFTMDPSDPARRKVAVIYVE